MSRKTIAKFYVIVISTALFAVVFSACSNVSSSGNNMSPPSNYGKPKVVGTIKSGDIHESSGLAASKCKDNVLWTHNDSDDGALIFAVNMAGENLGTWKVKNAENEDWEDIAAHRDKTGQCYLYIGEIGDNKLKRGKQAIYRVQEPDIKAEDANSNSKKPLETEPAEIARFEYPDQLQNSETLMVHPGDRRCLRADKTRQRPVSRLSFSACVWKQRCNENGKNRGSLSSRSSEWRANRRRYFAGWSPRRDLRLRAGLRTNIARRRHKL